MFIIKEVVILIMIMILSEVKEPVKRYLGDYSHVISLISSNLKKTEPNLKLTRTLLYIINRLKTWNTVFSLDMVFTNINGIYKHKQNIYFLLSWLTNLNTV